MKTNVICWLPESFYRNEECKQLLIENNIVPLLDSRHSKEIWEAQGKPYTLRELFYQADVPTYKDEPFSVKDGEDSEEWVRQTVEKYPDVTMGESSTEDIARLIKCGVKSVTFTSWGWHLFRIFGLNIRMPFTTQLNTWKKLEKLYGIGTLSEFMNEKVIRFSIRESKFTFCWIMLDQVKSFKKLVQWCITHNKTIGLVAPNRHKDNPEWVKEHLTEFINAYKEMVK